VMMGVWKTICLGWLQTVIPPISASQVARIVGVSHRCLARKGISKERKYRRTNFLGF
jgi:hypothetical protein